MTTEPEAAPSAAPPLDDQRSIDKWFVANILVHERALTNWFRQHTRDILSPSDAADMRQDVYIKVYEQLKITTPTQPKSYLFSVARNHMLDTRKRRKIVSIVYADDTTLGEISHGMVDFSPEKRWADVQDLEILSEALYDLPEDCRAVIWMRRVQGLSQRDTAEQLGMKEGTVESHVVRGLQLLANALFSEGRPKWFASSSTSFIRRPTSNVGRIRAMIRKAKAR